MTDVLLWLSVLGWILTMSACHKGMESSTLMLQWNARRRATVLAIATIFVAGLEIQHILR